MNKYTIEDTIRNYSRYMEIEEEDDERKGRAIELLLATQQVVKNPIDKAVLTLFCESEWQWEVERLQIFNGIDVIYETFDKFVSIFEQYYEKNEILFKWVDHLFVTQKMFDGWNYKEEKDELIDLLLSGEDLVYEENEGDDV